MMDDVGYLAIDLAVAPENLAQATTELLDVLVELRDKLIAPEELSSAIQSYLFDLEFSRDQTDALAVRYGWGLQARYLRTLEQDCQELKQLTSAMLQAAVRQFLRLETMKLVVVGPWSDSERRAVELALQQCRL